MRVNGEEMEEEVDDVLFFGDIVSDTTEFTLDGDATVLTGIVGCAGGGVERRATLRA